MLPLEIITLSEVVTTFPSESVHWKVAGSVDPSVVAVQVNVTSIPTCTGLGDSSTEVCRKVPAVNVSMVYKLSHQQPPH